MVFGEPAGAGVFLEAHPSVLVVPSLEVLLRHGNHLLEESLFALNQLLKLVKGALHFVDACDDAFLLGG